MIYRIPFTIQFALFIQPDAKVQNGIFWTMKWINLAYWIIDLVN